MKCIIDHKLSKVVIWLLLLTLLTCCNNQYDDENAAKVYCKCMKQNNAVEEFNKASAICGDKLNASNRYIKLWVVVY
jgi:hypothetical protein